MANLFKKVAQGVVGVGGVALAPFTGGASLALTAAAVSSAAQDSASNKAQKAANTAADQQIQAQKKAQLEIIEAQKKAEIEKSKVQQSISTQPQVILQSPINQGTNSDKLAVTQVKTDYTPFIILGGLAFIVLKLIKRRS